MSLKIAKKESVGTVVISLHCDKGEKGALTEVARCVIYPSDGVNEKLLQSLLAELQRKNPHLSFSTDDGPIIDYLADIDNLGTVAEQQESAIEILRADNEAQDILIKRLQAELKEAKEANEDWAAKFKAAKNELVPGLEHEVDNSESIS